MEASVGQEEDGWKVDDKSYYLRRPCEGLLVIGSKRR